ncbi:MAG: translocation/assembly module TamB domain-containing protein [Bacteroidales bacterium]|nr:translocation/assembly module TamB domain-containing protein [Bacteroidales bacterium]
MVSKFLVERLSTELKASISLSSVNYSFYKRIQIKDLYIEDQHGDTLLFAELTKLRIKQLRPERNRIDIRKITLENAFVNLVIDSSGVVNLKFITDRLKKPHVPPERKSKLHISSIELVDTRFSLSRMVKTPVKSDVNFTDLQMHDLQISVNDLNSSMDTVRMSISRLTGIEKSGFIIGQLTSQLSIGKRHLYFNDLEIITDESDLHIHELGFSFRDYSKFKQFSREVDLIFSLDHSNLKLADLSYFVPGVRGMLDRITIDGQVNGKLNDMRGEKLFVTFDQNSSLAFDFVMIGLPEINNTFLDFNFRELNTSIRAINDLLAQGKDTATRVLYPWTNLGNLDFNGHFTGYPDNFVASGLLSSDLGKMIMDLSFKPDSIHGVDFNGRLKTNDFRLGEFLDQENYLAQLDMNIFTDGNLYRGQIQADMDGTIDTLEFYQYTYSNITLNGAFTNNTFDGGFSISDPNIKMDFLGKMDFSEEIPVYDFTADVARARPFFLNLGQKDPDYFASFLIETNMSGQTLDQLNGEIKLVNSLFEKKDAQVQLYDMSLVTRNTPDSSMLQIRSDIFDADIEGRYRLSTLPASFRNLADQYVNVLPRHKPLIDSVNQFKYRLDFKRMSSLLDFFLPSLQIGKESQVEGKYNPSRQVCTTTGYFPDLKIARNSWSNLDLYSEIRDNEFMIHIQTDSMTFGEDYSLVDQQLLFRAARDTAHLDITWDNRLEPRYSGKIKMTGTYQADSVEDRGFQINVQPTELYVNDDLWEVSSSSIHIKHQYVKIDSLALVSQIKHIIANGTISSLEDKDFDLKIKNLNLGELSNLTSLNVDLEGNITGNINYQHVDKHPYIFTDLTIDTLYFNEQLLGPTSLNAAWNESERMINIKLLSEIQGSRVVEVDGSFSPGHDLLDFDVRFQEFALKSFNPYTSGVISDLDGIGNVKLTLDGTLKEPEINGSIEFKDGAATFALLNTRYIFNDQIRIYHNNLYLEDFLISDEYGNTARFNGSISNSHLKDFYTNINIEATNLMCMNTRPKDNEVFYGTIYATGNVGINGPTDDIKLTIDVSTERNTAIFLPLYNASEVQTTDFIAFLMKDDAEEEQPTDQIQQLTGLEMEVEVNVTPDAVVQLIFDPKVGDIIKTSGRGTLRISLDPANGFRMFGDVKLLTGDYLFTLQNVINKRFQIKPGGKINFNGSPTNATVDLDAIYTTRAAPYNLYPGEPGQTEETLKKRIPVECLLNLQGELLSPIISTGILMPTADPETRNLLENSTSTEEELMKQFLSLLVINNFYSVSGYGVQDMGTMNSSFAGITASELLSNQLSNWLSQISDDFDIGVNYRPGDQISSDEVIVALSTQLLDDRIIISGNVDVGGQETNPSSGAANNPYFAGDFDVEFKVTDNVSVIAFNRARDELLFETAPYKQGVGVSYREEFNDFSELMTRYKEGLTNRKKKKKKPGEPELND